MSPAFKYSYGRLGLFAVAFALLFPFPLNILVKAMIALIVSAVSSYFVLAKWRNEMGEQLSTIASRRSAEKERLRAALAGDEDAAAAGDRVAVADGPAVEDRVAVADQGTMLDGEAVSPADDRPVSTSGDRPAARDDALAVRDDASAARDDESAVRDDVRAAQGAEATQSAAKQKR